MCPAHGNVPSRNRDYWLPKLERNVARDHQVNAALAAADWVTIRAWEHENSIDVVERIAVAVVEERRAMSHPDACMSEGRDAGAEV